MMLRLRKSLAVALCIMVMAGVMHAQVRPPIPEILAPDLDARIAQGLAYLARQQQADGSFQNSEKVDEKTFRFSGPKITLTGLSLLAYLGAGRMPDTGKHGLAVRNGIEFLLKSCPENGYFGKVDGSRIYGHAIATLALAEACGMESDPAQRKLVRTVLGKAAKVLLQAQIMKKEDPLYGAWRHDINSGGSDLAGTAWCILALRAAFDAGVEIPKEPADRAAEFLIKCFRQEQKGFALQPGAEAGISPTASALLLLQLLGRGAQPEMPVAIKYLAEHPLADDAEFIYTSRYFSAQAAFQSGGAAWTKTWEQMQGKLIALQQKDGSWPKSKTAIEGGSTYATAMSIMTMSIPLRLLPAYQR